MTVRTRSSRHSVALGATRGPSRPRRFDGRLRDRRRAHPDPDRMRRRAEALLSGGAVGGGRETGRAPDPPPPDVREGPDGFGVRGVRTAAEGLGLGVDAEGVRPAVIGGAGARAGARAPVSGGSAEEAGALSGAVVRRLAVRERLPVWVQARCGVERRTVAAVAVVLAVAVGFAAQQYWSGRPQPVTAPAVLTPAPAPAPGPAPGAVPAVATGGRIVVDVGGKVRDPGVRRLPAGSRVEDALAAAGGVRPGTDTTGLNRARILVDGEQVLVGVASQPPPMAGAAGAGAGAGGGSGVVPLSLASATVEQLDGLPGVGPVLARHIVDFRTARGGFRAVEELRQVNGIGERRFADLRPLVRP
ncbi:helix-hairpin-helix domain-containing protein [Streptomyces sp. NPDC058623]|uniref:helix-hairpin-helix domain-containing protein n=1 Tax=Streptomyces sp. NPDC058623 TaxID=3346563 RepID=UPI003651E5F0